MNIDYLREFVVFSHYMNFSAAAKKLYISQPALSSHIKALEKDLSIQLIDRGASRLTRAGRVLVNESAELFNAYDNVIAKVKQAPDEKMNLTVAVESPNTDASSNWAIFRQRFLTEYPLFDCETIAPKHSTAAEILTKENVDCVVVYDYPTRADINAGLSFVRLPNYMNGRLSLWISDKHPLAQLQELHWSDMQDIKHPFAASIFRLWATGIKEALDIHDIRYTSRLIGGEGGNHLADLHNDEVQLYDSRYTREPALAFFPGWITKPLVDDDAESFAYLAYHKDHMNLALSRMIQYAAQCESGEEDPSATTSQKRRRK